MVLFGLALRAAALISFATVSYFTFVLIYRIFFHPLAKYPGPFLGKLTGLYGAYHAWKGDLHLDIWRCHLKYGKDVRYGPNRLLINSNVGLNDIYGLKKPVQKSKDYAGMSFRAPNTLTILDKKEHGRRRRVMSIGLSMATIRSYEPSIIRHVREMCDAIRRGEVEVPVNIQDTKEPTLEPGRWSLPIDMSKLSNYFAFDTMADLIFGMEYNMLGSTRWRYVCDAIESSNERMGPVLQLPALRSPLLDLTLFRNSIQERTRFLRFVGGMLRMRRGMADTQKNDLFSRLVKAVDPETGTGFTREQIEAESTTLIVAGSDTTSTALSGFFFYLTYYPHVYEKVTAEVRSVFNSTDQIVQGAALTSCVYLRACIDETLRISPSVGSALWREVESQGAMIDGHFIPGGCEVGTGIYSIHHHPEYYPEPFEFRPERWLADPEDPTRYQGQIALAYSAFNPFSLGARGCIGKGLALVEMQILLATLVFTFDFKRVSDLGQGRPGAELGREKESEFQLYDHVTSAKHGPILQFRERVLSC